MHPNPSQFNPGAMVPVIPRAKVHRGKSMDRSVDGGGGFSNAGFHSDEEWVTPSEVSYN